MPILLGCRRCGNTTTAAESRDRVCLLCLGREEIAPELARLSELHKKRFRYQQRGIPTSVEPIRIAAQRARRKLEKLLGIAEAARVGKILLDEVDAAAPKPPEPRILKVRTKDLVVAARG